MIYAYIRISTGKQDTDTQKHKIMEYANHEKIFIDEFLEIEISSRKEVRKRGITELIERMKEGDTLLCTELSRLGRNMLEILNLINELRENGVKIVFILQPFLNSTGNKLVDDIITSVFGAFAESERDLLSERTKLGLANAKKKGKRLGRKKGILSLSKYDKDHLQILELLNVGIKVPTIQSKFLKYGTRQSLDKWVNERVEFEELLQEYHFNDRYKEWLIKNEGKILN